MKISKKKGVALVAALVLIFVGAGLYSRKRLVPNLRKIPRCPLHL